VETSKSCCRASQLKTQCLWLWLAVGFSVPSSKVGDLAPN